MKRLSLLALGAAVSISFFAVSITPSEARRGFKIGPAAGFMVGKSVGKASARGRTKEDEQEEREANIEVSAERARLRAERVRQYNADHAQKDASVENSEASKTAPAGNILTVSQPAPVTSTPAANTASKIVCVAGCN